MREVQCLYTVRGELLVTLSWVTNKNTNFRWKFMSNRFITDHFWPLLYSISTSKFILQSGMKTYAFLVLNKWEMASHQSILAQSLVKNATLALMVAVGDLPVGFFRWNLVYILMTPISIISESLKRIGEKNIFRVLAVVPPIGNTRT